MEAVWSSTDVSEKLEECSSSEEREAKSIALEKTYVHDVYQQIASHFTEPRHRVWPRVQQFLLDLEPGSVVCDVGCGNGKYLDVNPSIYKIGLDRCVNLANIAREKNHEILVCDNLTLPFRDECFDAVLSVAVIHHFATTERRVEALRELSRVMRIGGKLMVSVWAMEQRHRKFDSQDVLVPWNKPQLSSSDDKTSSIERDLNSTTTTTSDDDVTHYHAYTQTSDSDSFPSLSRECRRRTGRIRHRGRSIDPHYPSSSHSSSDLSSPNESCYSFVRRALQKLAGTKRNRGGRAPWFLQGFDEGQDELNEPLASGNDDNNLEDLIPTGLNQLESSEFAELLSLHDSAQNRLLFSHALSPRRRRTLETTSGLHPRVNPIETQPKSKSLSDLLGLLPMSIFRGNKSSIDQVRRSINVGSSLNKTSKIVESHSSLSEILSQDYTNIQFPEFVKHKAVQTDSVESLEISVNGSNDSKIIIKLESDSSTFSTTVAPSSTTTSSSIDQEKTRPTLVKQKHSFGSTSFASCQCNTPTQSSTEKLSDFSTRSTDETVFGNDVEIPQTTDSSCWKDIQQSVKELPDFKNNLKTLRQSETLRVTPGLSSIWKQTSLNEDLIFTERLKEKEKLKQNIQKQCSLNEELIYPRRENTPWISQMKEAFFNHSNVKRIQVLKNNFSNRFRTTEVDTSGGKYETFSSTGTSNKPESNQTTSFRNGFVRMLKNWKTTDGNDENEISAGVGDDAGSTRRGSKEGTIRRGLFPPFFLRRSSVGSLNVIKKDSSDTSLSPLTSPPYLKRRPSENEFGHDLPGNGNSKLAPGVRHVRKLSREDGSDSSKDSSFQSDTSVDSEDSFASVIFIPRTNSVDNSVPGNENTFFNSDTRANSTDSDRSPKSPGLKLSPPNHNAPKSPSPLASELIRRKSPEISPTRLVTLAETTKQSNKFVFDETATLPKKEKSPTLSIDSPKIPIPQPSTQPLSGNAQTETKELAQTKPNPNKKGPGEKIEKIVVLRKPGHSTESKTILTRQQVRRSLPKELALELYNPEVDDVDTSDSSSSSPESVSSVVSVLNEESMVTVPVLLNVQESIPPTVTEIDDSADISNEKPLQQSFVEAEKTPLYFEPSSKLPVVVESDNEKNDDEVLPLDSMSHVERRRNKPASSSFENLVSHSTVKTRRKSPMSRLGNTSDWLHSLPSDVSDQHHQQLKRLPSERHASGEKMLFGEVKKFQQKGPDAKWPTSITDESSLSKEDEGVHHHGLSCDNVSHSSSESVPAVKNNEEFDEKESLFDSIENLTSKQHPSRNPSLDSSVRMSSTCSCSIRGGDSFDSWTSAKSSLTNSSSTHHKSSYPSLINLPVQSSSSKHGNSLSSDRMKRLDPTKEWSTGTEDTDDSALLTYHRYYHVFREGELDKVIEKYVQNLHVISSYYDHANWCIIAEKVQVWTI